MNHRLPRVAAPLLSAFALLCAPLHAQAQNYPDKPLKLIVGFSAGGGTDILARLVGQKLSERLGQPVVVENRPGANMNIGMEATAKAAPDGYTLGMAATPTVANPAMYATLPFDAAKDFTWITQLTTSSLVLLVNNDVPARTLPELIALAKKEPGKLSYASAGAGGSIHLSGILFARMAGLDMIHVPYKGNAPAFTDLLAGRVTMMFGDIPQVAAAIRGGKVRALAVSTPKRSPGLPDVPTLAEAGLTGYEVPVWYGVMGPAGIPKNIVNLLAKEMKEVLALPAVREQLAGWGVQPVGSSPEEFEAFARGEMAKWAGTVKGANLKLD